MSTDDIIVWDRAVTKYQELFQHALTEVASGERFQLNIVKFQLKKRKKKEEERERNILIITDADLKANLKFWLSHVVCP